MNKRLEHLIKIIELDSTKTHLIVLNNEQCTHEDGLKILKILKARGHNNVTALMTSGDVRTAVEVLEKDGR